MDSKELIQRLRAALSWELARYCENPALQASLELEREKSRGFHINRFGIHGKYRELFEIEPNDY